MAENRASMTMTLAQLKYLVFEGMAGVSPGVTITEITGGHRVTITDADHPSGQSFDVMDGDDLALPAVTSSDNGKVLTVYSGAWAARTPLTELYKVTYGSGSATTIVNVITNGKIPYCVYNSKLYIAFAYTDGVNKSVVFRCVWGSVVYTILVVDTTWSTSTINLAPLDSPSLTGTPKAPTATAGDNSTQIATTAFVQGEIAAKTVVIEISDDLYMTHNGEPINSEDVAALIIGGANVVGLWESNPPGGYTVLHPSDADADGQNGSVGFLGLRLYGGHYQAIHAVGQAGYDVLGVTYTNIN